MADYWIRFGVFLLVGFLVSACRAEDFPSSLSLADPAIQPSTPLSGEGEIAVTPATPTAATVPPTYAILGTPTLAPTTTPLPTSFFSEDLSPPCGLILPSLPRAPSETQSILTPDTISLERLRETMPVVARPALQRLIDAPESVGLAIYQVGRENEGVIWNADSPMPLASVAKLIVLVAYVEAVANGELDPLAAVTLVELEQYYLPNFDLGAHRRAVQELREGGRVFSEEGAAPYVLLEDVAWMMVRHSSNAASDYLHHLLGQSRIEETALALGLDQASGQTAPCTFLGQFLVMANHTRAAANDRASLESYLQDEAGAEVYGRDVALLFDAYREQASFRQSEVTWRSEVRRPTIETQRFFAGRLAPQGTARAYGELMARLAQNGLSNADSSYQARRYLEWPMRFPVNQESFSNLGYKNGSLPGVLTTAYYGYRLGESAPVVIAMFYRDLPQQTYRRWRFDLPHDELARWLLADPEALPLLAAALNQATP